MKKKNILFLKGINDDRRVIVFSVTNNNHYNIGIDGSSNIYEFLNSERFSKHELCFDTNQDQKLFLKDVDVVFNQIADSDSHTIALSKAAFLEKQINGKIPFFNKAENIRKTARDEVYRLLDGEEDLTVPKTIKIVPDTPDKVYEEIRKAGMVLPVILRKAGDHGGISTILIENDKEQFHAFPLDGRAYYLTQFIEQEKYQGLYRKIRLIVINGEVFLRHIMFSEEWMVHNKNQKEDLKEIAHFSKRFNKEVKPKITDVIIRIHKIIGLDYFGIDCDIDENGNITIYELNATMNVLYSRDSSIFKKHVERIRDALITMLVG